MQILGSIISFLIFAAIAYYGYKYLKAQGFTFPWEKSGPVSIGKGGNTGAPKGK